MSENDMLRNIAVEYAASGEADYGQFFTNPDCRVFDGPEGFVSVQVWISIPRKVIAVEFDRAGKKAIQ